MTKQNVSKFFKNVGSAVSKRSPEILTAIGLTAGFSTVVLAVKATPKAMTLIEEAEREKRDFITDGGRIDVAEGKCKLTKKEIIKAAYKPYIPAIVTGVMSGACIIGSRSVSARRNAALATAYKLSEAALTEYKKKVVETIGEVQEKEIRDKVIKEKIEKTPTNKKEVIITEKGETLCFDVVSGRYFKSDMIAIEAAINRLNKKLLSYDYVSLNEFYEEISLPSVRLGDDLGWNLHRDGLVEVTFSSQLSEEGKPCLAVDYLVAPRYDFSKLM